MEREHSSLRVALIERWFDIDEEHHETITDEQILGRIVDLVEEGWHAAGLESERAAKARKLLMRTYRAPSEYRTNAWFKAVEELFPEEFRAR